MVPGRAYRVASGVTVTSLSVLSLLVANTAPVQELLISLPPFRSLSVAVLSGEAFVWRTVVGVTVIVGWLVPTLDSTPVHPIDAIIEAVSRIVYAFITLATVGYFDYTYALPRPTLVVFGVCSVVTVPLALGGLRQIERRSDPTQVLVADSQRYATEIAEACPGELAGYVAPGSPGESDIVEPDGGKVLVDGHEGAELDYLGGLSRLPSVVDQHSVDTVFVAFERPDRGDFFGVLETCRENGVRTMVEQTNQNLVLTDGENSHPPESSLVTGSRFVETQLNPWKLQDRLLKRLFDVAFAAVGLVVTLPLTLCIALAIKLDSRGPVLFTQKRTFQFGGTFRFYKFRSMVENAEAETGVTISEEDAGGVDPRVTRVGRILRRTHLDEIPQLWSILVGDMSVVGPRPAQTAIEHEFESGVPQWPKRWFVKPGLTGLAQIREVTGLEPAEKLQNDLEYIRRQSTLLDTKIVIKQVYITIKKSIKIFK